MTQAPQVSVVMPVYNAERYLREAVESILNQTFTDFEFIIIDDGSTDGSLKILREYADNDPRIRLISRENRGTAGTLNEGIELAKGPLIARMDADDISLPERLERQIPHINTHPEMAALGTFARQILPCGGVLDDMTFPLEHEAVYRNILHFRGPWMLHPTVVFRAEHARAIGGYTPEYPCAQDNDFFLRLGERGTLANLPEALFLYRQHPGNTCYSRPGVQALWGWRAAVAACERQGIPLPPSLEKEPAGARPRLHRSAVYTRWAWKLLARGEVGLARKYTVRAIAARPWTPGVWRLAACAVRGR